MGCEKSGVCIKGQRAISSMVNELLIELLWNLFILTFILMMKTGIYTCYDSRAARIGAKFWPYQIIIIVSHFTKFVVYALKLFVKSVPVRLIMVIR